MQGQLINSNSIQYEHPLNEKIRVFLRVEHLWKGIQTGLQQENDAICLNILHDILQLLEINERFDLRSDAIKYLDKLIVRFFKMREQDDVDLNKLNNVIDSLNKILANLKSSRSKFATSLSANEWLTTIRQKTILAGGMSGADLPFLKYWQQFTLQQKIQQLSKWSDLFYPIVNAILTVLSYIRKTSHLTEVDAISGNYQKIIDNNFEPQLLLIEVNKHYNVYPEVSGNRLRFAIRFLQTDLEVKARQYSDNIEFKLAICS